MTYMSWRIDGPPLVPMRTQTGSSYALTMTDAHARCYLVCMAVLLTTCRLGGTHLWEISRLQTDPQWWCSLACGIGVLHTVCDLNIECRILCACLCPYMPFMFVTNLFFCPFQGCGCCSVPSGISCGVLTLTHDIAHPRDNLVKMVVYSVLTTPTCAPRREHDDNPHAPLDGWRSRCYIGVYDLGNVFSVRVMCTCCPVIPVSGYMSCYLLMMSTSCYMCTVSVRDRRGHRTECEGTIPDLTHITWLLVIGFSALLENKLTAAYFCSLTADHALPITVWSDMLGMMQLCGYVWMRELDISNILISKMNNCDCSVLSPGLLSSNFHRSGSILCCLPTPDIFYYDITTCEHFGRWCSGYHYDAEANHLACNFLQVDGVYGCRLMGAVLVRGATFLTQSSVPATHSYLHFANLRRHYELSAGSGMTRLPMYEPMWWTVLWWVVGCAVGKFVLLWCLFTICTCPCTFKADARVGLSTPGMVTCYDVWLLRDTPISEATSGKWPSVTNLDRAGSLCIPKPMYIKIASCSEIALIGPIAFLWCQANISSYLRISPYIWYRSSHYSRFWAICDMLVITYACTFYRSPHSLRRGWPFAHVLTYSLILIMYFLSLHITILVASIVTMETRQASSTYDYMDLLPWTGDRILRDVSTQTHRVALLYTLRHNGCMLSSSVWDVGEWRHIHGSACIPCNYGQFCALCIPGPIDEDCSAYGPSHGSDAIPLVVMKCINLYLLLTPHVWSICTIRLKSVNAPKVKNSNVEYEGL